MPHPCSRMRRASVIVSNRPVAAVNRAASMPKHSPSRPQKTLPRVSDPWKMVLYTARPRALTQSGSNICAATLNVDIDAIQVAPGACHCAHSDACYEDSVELRSLKWFVAADFG